MGDQSKSLTYRDAGVDIDAGNSLVERIKPAAASTRRRGVIGGLGGFGALFDLKAAGFRDPFGNLWNVATHVEDVSDEEMERRMEEAMKAMQ